VRKRPKPLLSRPTGPRPEDAPLGSLESRAAARAWLLQNRKRYQMIFADCDSPNPTPLNLESSSCHREIWPGGWLFELIMLDGRLADLTEEQLQAFIDRHPIKRNTTAQ